MQYRLSHILPPLKGDLATLTPSTCQVAIGYFIFDDSRARLPPKQGGLGYTGTFTTIEGALRTLEEYLKERGAN